jgi:heme/copper-type cytochrome/quinol oxidase subunit 4
MSTKDFIIAMYLMLFMTCPVIIGLMIAYLKQKALALQTPFDQVCINLGYGVVTSVLRDSISIVIALTWGPFSVEIADVLSKIVYLQTCLLMATIVATIFLRYILLFHGHLIEEIDDDKVVNGIRIGTCILAICVFLSDLKFGKSGGWMFQAFSGTLGRYASALPCCLAGRQRESNDNPQKSSLAIF